MEKAAETPTTQQSPPARITTAFPDNQPAGSPVHSGSAGITGERAEKLSTKAAISPLPLPGMERDFPPLPFELDICSQSLTEEAYRILEAHEKEKVNGVGATLKIYPNGEVTGGTFIPRYHPPPKRDGKIISQEFTSKARKKIRMAVECCLVPLYLFLTLTFDPKLAQLDEEGRVLQSWAKKEFKRFLNSMKIICDRIAEKQGKLPLSYIWVAEVQKNGNIHFHILVDRFLPVKWLVTLWNQASNSVNVKRLHNQGHAARYMLKYMKKGNCPIEGKRYGMTQNLMEAVKPVKYRFVGEDYREAFRTAKGRCHTEIQDNGGMVSSYGLYIPAPKRATVWRDMQGCTRRTKAVPRSVSDNFMRQLRKEIKKVEFDRELDEYMAERQAIMASESGKYAGKARLIDFGGDK